MMIKSATLQSLPGRPHEMTAPVPGDRLRVLIADGAMTEGCLLALRGAYLPSVTRTVQETTRRLIELNPAVIVANLELPDGDGVEICRATKGLPRRPLLIVTGAVPARVPDALLAGCNAVLLKPYPPNLLCARIGRLLQMYDDDRRHRRGGNGDGGASEMTVSHSATTNKVRPDIDCPGCGASGVTAFDFASHRRMWCACLGCRHVWLARRHE
ncbi:MAG: hypothetical protein DMF87_01885 [Acidobacteria bacterium]|nr:MAG: hypothetical protein DMF87_01885 [Acidobacteriota bacterium]